MIFIYLKEATGVETWVEQGVNPVVPPLLNATSLDKQGPVFEVSCTFRLQTSNTVYGNRWYVEGFLN